MDEEANNNSGGEERWFIDLNWYQKNRRSFPAMAQRCLCSKCRKKLKVDEGEAVADKLLAAIRDCCSMKPEFITGDLPVMESIFRILLAGGNEPASVAEIGERLRSRRQSVPASTVLPMLTRLLKNDWYYGLSLYQD